MDGHKDYIFSCLPCLLHISPSGCKALSSQLFSPAVKRSPFNTGIPDCKQGFIDNCGIRTCLPPDSPWGLQSDNSTYIIYYSGAHLLFAHCCQVHGRLFPHLFTVARSLGDSFPIYSLLPGLWEILLPFVNCPWRIRPPFVNSCQIPRRLFLYFSTVAWSQVDSSAIFHCCQILGES